MTSLDRGIATRSTAAQEPTPSTVERQRRRELCSVLPPACRSTSAGSGAGGDAQGDSLFEIENLVGSELADGLFGNGFENEIDGGAGADFITGEGGDDTLTGGRATTRSMAVPATTSSRAARGMILSSEWRTTTS